MIVVVILIIIGLFRESLIPLRVRAAMGANISGSHVSNTFDLSRLIWVI